MRAADMFRQMSAPDFSLVHCKQVGMDRSTAPTATVAIRASNGAGFIDAMSMAREPSACGLALAVAGVVEDFVSGEAVQGLTCLSSGFVLSRLARQYSLGAA
jgi:hypothetical protein